MTDSRLIELTADIVSAHVSNNNVATSDVSGLIHSVFAALTAAETPEAVVVARADPAVPIRSSIKPEYIVCLEDGAKLKMLRRYLRTNFDMSPEDYRTKWGLPRDYPMVAPAYSEQRRTLAKTIGLGRTKTQANEAAAKEATAPAGKEAGNPVAKSAKAPAKKPVKADANSVPKKRGRPAKDQVTVSAPVSEAVEA